MSSLVRKLYYHQRPTPFPRVVGIIDLWDWSIVLSNTDYSESSVAWSPCGQFVATQTKEAVDVRDVLTFELLFTLRPTKLPSQLTGTLAYSPDGRSLACASDNAIVIWDIQTGGVARNLEYNKSYSDSLVWSLDGSSIGAVVWDKRAGTLTILRYEVGSATALPPITHRSRYKPYIWAHAKTFRVMTTAWRGEACIIEIFEIKSALSKVESFPVKLGGQNRQITSFSPAAYRISVSNPGDDDRLIVLNVRNSGGLLDEEGDFVGHCFSSDGGFFAASRFDKVYTWKYDDGRYNPAGSYPTLTAPFPNLVFSPSSVSIMGNLKEILKVWRLDGPPVDAVARGDEIGIFSRSGAYLITTHFRESTITVASSHSSTPSQLIDTEIEISGLGLTSNVLLVAGSGMVAGWLLTEEGRVDSVFGGGKAGRSDSIWTVPTPECGSQDLTFAIEGEIGVIKSEENVIHVYNTETGEMLDPTQTALRLSGPWYSFGEMIQARRHVYDGSVGHSPILDDWKPSEALFREGWMEGREGEHKHMLWLPNEWRGMEWDEVEWLSDIATVQFASPHFGCIIARLH